MLLPSYRRVFFYCFTHWTDVCLSADVFLGAFNIHLMLVDPNTITISDEYSSAVTDDALNTSRLIVGGALMGWGLGAAMTLAASTQMGLTAIGAGVGAAASTK